MQQTIARKVKKEMGNLGINRRKMPKTVKKTREKSVPPCVEDIVMKRRVMWLMMFLGGQSVEIKHF